MIEWIQTPQDLHTVLPRIQASNPRYLAFDTEFVRRTEFYAAPGLLQLAWPDTNGHTSILLIDLVALPCESVQNFLNHLYSGCAQNNIDLLAHAPTEDLQLFDHYGVDRFFDRLLDTQIAGAYLGLGSQLSLFDLAKTLNPNLAVVTDSHAQANWRRRPLSWREIAYAAQDAKIVCEIAPVLYEQLGSNLQKVFQDCECLYKAWPSALKLLPYATQNTVLSQVPTHLRARYSQLVEWREQAIRIQNVPRRWHISDAALAQLARLGHHEEPPKIKLISLQLFNIRGRAPSHLHKHAKDLFFQALDLPSLEKSFYQAWQKLPEFPPELVPIRLSKQSRPTLTALEHLTQQWAKEQGVPQDAAYRRTWLKKMMETYAKRQSGFETKYPCIFLAWRAPLLQQAEILLEKHWPYTTTC